MTDVLHKKYFCKLPFKMQEYLKTVMYQGTMIMLFTQLINTAISFPPSSENRKSYIWNRKFYFYNENNINPTFIEWNDINIYRWKNGLYFRNCNCMSKIRYREFVSYKINFVILVIALGTISFSSLFVISFNLTKLSIVFFERKFLQIFPKLQKLSAQMMVIVFIEFKFL